ncbi:Activating signal cointegrator 1 [Dimargaris verticillata]|uniref:Activating signal cointegrator 1 n=1 Tax=Dimargaris verticillata TaxID=2761393 RepID=A0A9W8B713_9FUNG|nr:Activating signal cointegrator 1 [Dimargaris verticillata]
MGSQSLIAWTAQALADRLQLSLNETKPLAINLVSLASEAEIAMQLAEILGESESATQFATTFVRKRFPSGAPKPCEAAANPSSHNASPGPQRRQQSGYAPIGGITITTLTRKSKAKSKQPAGARASTLIGQPVASMDGLSNKERAKYESRGDRPACTCEASIHDLLTNCLTCGRIICAREGPGPCLTCGALVVSADQQRRMDIARRQQQSALTSTPADVMDQVAQAEARKEQLLEYDRTSAARTRVIDRVGGFQLPEDHELQWMTPQEKIEATRQRQRHQARQAELDDQRRRGVQVLSINLETHMVTRRDLRIEDTADAEGTATLPAEMPPKPSTTGTGYFANNPLLRSTVIPKYISPEDPSDEPSSACAPTASSESHSLATQRQHERAKYVDDLLTG